jgi:hypothetical protein
MSKIKVFYLFLNIKTTEQSDTIILGILGISNFRHLLRELIRR